MSALGIPRRTFLVGLGLSTGTLALGLGRALGADAKAAKPAAAAAPRNPQLPAGGFAPNAFVHVAPDGLVTIVSHRSEMGQGIRSTLPALLAEEMGASSQRVRILQADGDAIYGDQNTDGSASAREATDSVRKLGAAARTMLVAAAAKRWRVPPAACDARDHAVVHEPSGRTLDFGALAALAAAQPVPKTVELRRWADLRRIGGDLPHVDAPDIVAGRAAYGADVRLPDMLIAVVARPPALGGKVARHDDSRALAVPGVKRIIELPAAPAQAPRMNALGGLAVLADTTWAALRGRDALDVEWDAGPNGDYDSTKIRAELLAAVRAPATVVRKVGDVDAALAAAARKVTAEYTVPHLAHATMEPPAALARVDANGAEVWMPTQDPQGARRAVAKALDLKPERVTIHVTLLGCGFGRKSFADFGVEAALLARAAGVPVRVQWTREDDLRHDYLLPASAQRLEAGVDESGRVVAWLHRTSFTPLNLTFDAKDPKADVWELAEGVTETPLVVPAVRCEHAAARFGTRVGWLRGVHNNQHAFAVQSFIDELARTLNKDPRDLLLELIGPPRTWGTAELGVPKLDDVDGKFPIEAGRLAGVVERVTAAARWSERRRAGAALGLAAHRTEISYAAWVVELARAPNGGFRVEEAWGAIDAGRILNRDRVVAQMEGAFVFGMSVALYGAITMAGGAATQSNFHDYKLVRLPEVPRAIHVEIVPSEAPPGGVGEVGEPPVAPAIANALAALTGERRRDLPLKPPA